MMTLSTFTRSVLLVVAAISLGTAADTTPPPVLTVPTVAGGAPAATPAPASDPASNAALVKAASYAIGFSEIGAQYDAPVTAFGLDTDEIIAGLRDALAHKQARISPAQQQAAIQQLIKNKREQTEKVMADLNSTAAVAKRKAETPANFADNKKAPGVITTTSGLEYTVLTAGKGPQAALGSTVTVRYTGWKHDGTVFDASAAHGDTATFPLQQGHLIPGWVEALPMMKVGDKWRLFIPSNLAYGAKGMGNTIGPNEDLIFDVELVKAGAAPVP